MFSRAGVWALLCALTVSPSAAGAFTGLQLELHTTFTTGGVARNVYRLYARFSDGADQLTLWGGGTDHAAVIRTCNSSVGAGTAFFNHASGTNTAPTQTAINSNGNARWDTFATIGVNIADQGVPSDQTLLTPSFPTFISNNIWTTNLAAVFLIPGAAQARADFTGDGDAQLRVLMAQLTCRTTESVGGKVGILTWRNAAGVSVTLNDLTIPSLATLGYCCLANGSCQITSPANCTATFHGTFIGCAVCGDCAIPCEGDIDLNGVVDIDDFLVVINSWQFQDEPGDINHSGKVDIDDLLIIVNHWGPCP